MLPYNNTPIFISIGILLDIFVNNLTLILLQINKINKSTGYYALL